MTLKFGIQEITYNFKIYQYYYRSCTLHDLQNIFFLILSVYFAEK